MIPPEWKDEETKEKWVKNVRSLGLITLGKKSYIDKLEGVDKDGNKHYTYHIRLKGISPAAIEDHVKKKGNTMQTMMSLNCIKDCSAVMQYNLT